MNANSLYSEGLLNRDSQDLRDYTDQVAKKLIAKCPGCRKGSLKEVASSTQLCPDCGNYLVWKWVAVKDS